MKVSDLFVKCLEAEGVERIFGVPGEENADFVMSLEGSPIDLVLTRHDMLYGGVKDSGLGREGIRFAIEDMTEIRLMVLRTPR